MSQILVRNIRPEVVKRLKELARGGGRSLQGQVRTILEQAAAHPKLDGASALALVDRFRARFKARKFRDSAELIRRDRDR